MARRRGGPSLARTAIKGAARTYWQLQSAIVEAARAHGPLSVPCAVPGVDDLWFSEDARSTARAKSLCMSCPVVVECALHGIEHEDWGVWGGMSEPDRREARRDRDSREGRTAMV